MSSRSRTFRAALGPMRQRRTVGSFGKALVMFASCAVVLAGALGCSSEPRSDAGPSASSSAPAVLVASTTATVVATTPSASASSERASARPPLPSLGDRGSLEDAPYAVQAAEGKMSKPLFWCERQELSEPRDAYGHVLDDRGRVWFVNFGRAWTPHPAGELHPASVLEARYRWAILQTRRVPQEVLARVQEKAQLADQRGQIQPSSMPLGHLHPSITSCEAYLWQEDGRYRRLVLGQFGEYTSRHSAPEAKEVWDWLHHEVGMGWRGSGR